MHKKPLSIESRASVESPFLDQELFVERGDPKSERRAAALAEGSPFQNAFEEGWRSFDAPEMEQSGCLSEEPFSEAETGVIDGDNRVRITPTVGVPWRWICKVEVKRNNAQPNGGTGVLVSNRHVLTAAHVVHEASRNMQNFSIQIIPALDYGDEPFDSYVVTAKPKLPGNYDPDAEDKWSWDYALLKLNTAVGKKTFGKLNGNALSFWGSQQGGATSVFARHDPATLNGKPALTAGYPRSAGAKKLMCAAGMLHSANRLRRTMGITADTTKGQSGSPVWIVENGKLILVGIAAGAGERTNTVVRGTREFVRQLRAWITEDGETPSMIEAEEASEFAASPLPDREAEYDELSAAEWSRGASEEKEDFTGAGYGGDELELFQEQPLDERFDPAAIPADVAEALGKKDWARALELAIQAGWHDENELTNLIFFARHPELPPEKLNPKIPSFKLLSFEWSGILDREVWKAIEASATNTDLAVSGEEVADHHRRFFQGKTGKKLKKLVEDAAREVDLNPGLLGTIMMAETRRPQSYFSSEKVSSYHIGVDDFYEGRAAIQARVPAYAKVKWDKKQTPLEHLNDAKTNRRVVKTILFDSGPDAVLATAVYLKFREVRLREIAAKLKGDFDKLPVAAQFALTRMAMGAGTGGATPFLKDALKGVDILVRKAIPVAAYQTQRNATVRTAQAMHLSDWVFGIKVAPVTRPEKSEEAESEDHWAEAEADNYEGDVDFEHSSTSEFQDGPAEQEPEALEAGEEPATVIDPFPAPYPLALNLVNASFNSCVDAAPTNPDVAHLCGALADLTGKPPSPLYRGHNHNDMLYVGSLAKIYLMYAAYELMHRVEMQAKKLIKGGLSTNTFGWQNKIFAELKKAWGPKLDAAFPPPLPSGFPRLGDIFQITPNGDVHFSERIPALTDAELDAIGEFGAPKGKFRDWMRLTLRWSNNSAASKCILALSYPYINGVLGSGGFFDKTTRNGLWISGDYLGHDWRPGGRAGQPLTPRWAKLQKRQVTNFAGTACQVARLLTLIAQGKLIDRYSSTDMISVMQGANGIDSYVQSAFTGALPPRPFSSISSKIGFGNDRFSHDCAIVRADHGDDPGRALCFVTVILGSPPDRGRADLTKLAVAYYDCVRSRHP